MASLIEVRELKKYFPVSTSLLSRRSEMAHAVDGIDFTIEGGEILALVGESGCGKSTTGKLILRLLEPTSGTIYFEGEDISDFEKKRLKDFRREVQIVFQDTLSSLNPRKTIFQILSRPFLVHEAHARENLRDKVAQLLETVGLNPSSGCIDKYPHHFSGGQRQRIVIARAIALHPRFVVADEPVSSLDMSIRAQILALLGELQRKFEMACLYITHDLATARFFSARIAVMYLGKIVEICESKELFDNPLHPYTKALLSSRPIPDPQLTRNMKRLPLIGEVPSSINLPLGCRYQDRCRFCMDDCRKVEPEMMEIRKGHLVACYNITQDSWSAGQ